MKIPAELMTLMTAATLAGCVSHASVTPAPAPAPAVATEPAPEAPAAEVGEAETVEEAGTVEEHLEISGDYCPPCGRG